MIKISIYYTIRFDDNNDKFLSSLNDFDFRIHPNHNLRKRYMSGMFGGIPNVMDIDFDELVDDFQEVSI